MDRFYDLVLENPIGVFIAVAVIVGGAAILGFIMRFWHRLKGR